MRTRAKLIAAMFIGCFLIACDDKSTPQSAGGSGGGNQRSSNPIDHLAENPQSVLGKSAGAARDVAQKANAAGDEAANLANEIGGRADALTVGAVNFTIPESWEKTEPGNSMQAASYRLARGEGGEPETMVVFFSNIGGSVDSNVERWRGQVTTSTGGKAEARVNTETINGLEVTTVAMDGTYAGMMGQPPMEGAGFRAAIVRAPGGLVYARLTGPRETVEEKTDEFFRAVKSVRK